MLERGYEPQLFIEFLETRRDNGSDIDRWTLKELKEQVLEFKSEVDIGTISRESMNKI